MSIVIGKLEFEGPFCEEQEIRPEPGLYGILCQVNDEFELIELGETACLQDCLKSGEHMNNLLFYAETCKGQLSAVVHYSPDLTFQERTEIKDELLSELNATEHANH